jgi:hypothetical protein
VFSPANPEPVTINDPLTCTLLSWNVSNTILEAELFILNNEAVVDSKLFDKLNPVS